MNFKIILSIVIVCLAVLFVIQNAPAVTVSILFWKISLSLALLIFLTVAFGLLAGWLLHSFFAYRKTRKEVAEIASRDVEPPKG